MTAWRLTLAAVLLLVVAVPLAAPLGELLADPAGWQSWREAERMLALAGSTLQLVAGTLALVMPAGLAGAVLMYRTDLPLRRLLRVVTVLTLFVPLPLFTSGWQTVLGSGGWLPVPGWTGPGVAWAPWGQGIGSAVWVHAVAALPWVVLLVGQGLCWVERELEEDALTLMPAWRVLFAVSLPRAGAAVGAAALWVSLQAATEITVTDVMQVRTAAEEVYTQIVGGAGVEGDGIARAVAASLPFVVLMAVLVAAAANYWGGRLPARATLVTPPLLFRLGWMRLPAGLAAAAVCAALVVPPLAGLVWRAGVAGSPPAWSPMTVGRHLVRACRPPEGVLVLDSLLLAASAGALTATAALVACWAARGSRWLRGGVLALMAAVWAMPGPLVGLGLKAVIEQLLSATDSRWLARALYYGPSPLPLLWVDFIRFFPCAVAVLWPVTRLLPAELCDAARVDGATPARELRYVVWPLTSAAWLRGALAVGVLSLGELSAGKLVATPGLPGYATEIFTQMHYGVTGELAARCLLLLAAVAAGGAAVAAIGRRPPLDG